MVDGIPVAGPHYRVVDRAPIPRIAEVDVAYDDVAR